MAGVFRILTFIACLAALWWVYVQPREIERWVVFFGALAAFAGAFVSPIKRRLKGGMSQEVGSDAIGVQAGRDAKVSVSRDLGPPDAWKKFQTAAEGAVAVQADGNVQIGVSSGEARQIALDVYDANFPRLVEQAAQLARARAEELTDKFLVRMEELNPGGLMQASQPDFQYALLNAQKKHACAGSANLADLLVDLLVERTKVPHRDLLQIVLDEALTTVPKLTEQQLAVLGVAFLYGRTTFPVATWGQAVGWIREHFEPLCSVAEMTASTISHLQYAGCGSVNPLSTGAVGVEKIFLTRYPGFFQVGFTQQELEKKTLSQGALQLLIKPLAGNPGLLSVAARSADFIDSLKEKGGLDEISANGLKELLESHLKSPTQTREQIFADIPCLEKVDRMWRGDKLHTLTLSSVGTAIGHAYVQKTIKREFASLSIWIS